MVIPGIDLATGVLMGKLLKIDYLQFVFLIYLCSFGTSGRHSSLLMLRQSTGNVVSGHYKQHKCLFFLYLFFLFFFLGVYFSHRRSARIKKNYFAKVDESAPNPRGKHLSRPRWPFWILNAVWALQSVSEHPRCCQAGILKIVVKHTWEV